MQHRQRGYVALLYLVLALAVLGALWWIYESIDSRAFKRGRAEVEAEVAQRDNKALAAVLVKLKAAQDRVREIEADAAADLAALADTYEKEKRDDTKRRNAVVADLRTGGLRLRIPVASGAAECARSPGTETPAGAGERDGRASAELSGPAAEFLVDLASEADEVVRQLKACQGVVRADRAGQEQKPL